jgi:hypothetical protein
MAGEDKVRDRFVTETEPKKKKKNKIGKLAGQSVYIYVVRAHMLFIL